MTDRMYPLVLQQHQLVAASTVLLGVGAFWVAAALVAILQRHRRVSAESWEFDEKRRIRLRAGSRVYWLFEPLIDELARVRWVRWLCSEGTQTALYRGATGLPWQPAEFVAHAVMQAILVFVGVAFLGSGFFHATTFLPAAAVLAILLIWLAIRGIEQEGTKRLAAIETRLPFSVDLIALMMGAGADFEQSLQTVIRESPEHPFSEEFDKVLQAVNRGQVLSEALERTNQKLSSELVRTVVFAVNKANELGSPLADTFLELADQMRLKKSQWAENKAGQAQTNISFPGLLIMCACLLTIAGLFILPNFYG